MGRIIGIDYGTIKTGLAVTDENQIIACPLCTVSTTELKQFLFDYLTKESVESIVIGQTFQKDGSSVPHEEKIKELIIEIENKFSQISIYRQEEEFTSVYASEIVFHTVKKKNKRRDKSLLDKISATIILQNFLGHHI